MLSVFAIAACAAWAGTAGSRALANRIGFVSRPNPIVPQHVATIAYLGGLGVAAGLLATFGATVLLANIGVRGLFPSGQLAGALGFFALGIVDDARPLTPRTKFVGQTLLAAVFVWLNGGWRLTGIGVVDVMSTIVFILVVVNAVNLTDVCDGLVAGLAAISALTFLALMGASTILPAAIAGSCLGFLTLNAPPARIFLGDAGSHLLGFLLAALAIEHVNARPEPAAIAASLLTLGVFLFELAFLVVARTRKGIPWWHGSPDHFALRLQAEGLSRWSTDLRAWIAASILGFAALAVERMSAFGASVVFAIVLATGLGVAARLFRMVGRMTAPAASE